MGIIKKLFLKKDTTSDTYKVIEQEHQVLKNILRQAVEGKYLLVDSEQMQDVELATLYNQVISKLLQQNNEYAMKLNNTMSVVGNATIIETMLESVSTQDKALDEMKQTSQYLGQGIKNISSVVQDVTIYVNSAVDASKNSVDHMSQSIQMANKSCEDFDKISEMIQAFKVNTRKVNEIIDIVKAIAGQTNLLSLNASIEAARAGEAGKGFGVVANEVKNLAESTRKSTEAIESYISELQHEIDKMVVVIGQTTDQVKEGNKGVQKSIEQVKEIYNAIKTVDEDIVKINTQINQQEQSTSQFVKVLDEIAGEANNINTCCNGVGELMFKVSRAVDSVRGHIARYAADLSISEWLEIFKVDHTIYTWRLFNHIYGFEHLELEKINNPTTCKLGKWYTTSQLSQYDETSINQVKKYHEALHEKGVACFHAVENNKKKEALEAFNEAKEILNQLNSNIERLKKDIERHNKY